MRVLFIQRTLFHEVDSRTPTLFNSFSIFSLDQVSSYFPEKFVNLVFSWTLSFYGGQYLKILDNEKTKAWLVFAAGMIALAGIVFWWMMIGNGLNTVF
jgi:hypothetical protein